MKSERWQRLEELFESASRLPVDERDGFLEESCGADLGLRRDVESLLAAVDPADSFLDRAVSDAARAFAQTASASTNGRRIGAYQVERELGHGGMGKVYLAVRADDEYQKQVAIKLIRWGADDPDVRRRFLAERQILANLDHPYIARLLDGGTTEDGLPYVVMEHVDGEPIHNYCDARQLTTTDRLRLFRRVCEAVQYAHGNLVVHRDIKPKNILVTSDGTPKLLDFGIAKLLDADARGTHTHGRMMTPEYASPEQVMGGPITTASDVYSLGVLLYELLTGQGPYRVEGDTPGEIERAICEDEPERPSTAVTRDSERVNGGDPVKLSPESLSQNRGVSPERLRRDLSGDLDTIVLMALRKEPLRRYASADQFSQDIRRYLEGRPVQARKDTLAYRAGKFVRRHRVPIAATAAGMALIAVLTGFFFSRVARERDIAREEAVKAAQVASFLTDLFEVSDPGESRGEDLTAREILDRGAERVQRELADQPEVQAEMLGVIGRTYEKLGLYDEAMPLLSTAMELESELHGAGHVDVANALDDLASVFRQKGEYAVAESLFTRALAIHEDRLGERQPETVASLNSLALVTEAQGDAAGAEERLRDALERSRDFTGEDREIVGTVMSNLGSLLIRLGRYQEAESIVRESLALRRQLKGDDHPDVGTSLNHLATVFRKQGRYDEAEAIHREQIEWGRRVLGDEHPSLVTWMNNLAAVLKDKGEYAQAEEIQREVLTRYKARLGEEHPLVAVAYNNLANLRHDQGDFEEAERYHTMALELNRKLFGDKHFSIANNLNNIAALLADKGENDRAAEYQRRVLQLDRELLGERHEYVAMDHNSLGTFLLDAGRPSQAETELREAYIMASEILGDEHPSTATCAYGLGRLLAKTGRYAEAEPIARQAVHVRQAKLPQGHWATALAQTLLGETLAGLGRYEEAERELKAGYHVLVADRPAGDRYRSEGRARFAKLYRLWGRSDKAEALPH